jgi:hypothetical protein
MLTDLLTLFSVKNRFLIRKSFKKGILVAFMGSILFTFIAVIVSFIRSEDLSPLNDPEFFEIILFSLGFIGGVAFVLSFLPVTFSVALLTLRMKSLDFQTANVTRKFMLDGALLGGIVSLGIGLFLSFLNGLFIESSGHGSMIGVTLFTLEAVLVGTIMGGLTALFLVKQKDIT